jgi:hypothetical protein
MEAPNPDKPSCCSQPAQQRDPAPCCGAATIRDAPAPAESSPPWIIGRLSTPVGDVPQVDTALRTADRLGAWRMRWGIGRMRYRVPPARESWVGLAAWCLLVPTLSSFMAMNFTGSTNYTLLSGVRREMRTAVPIQAASGVAGLVLWLAGRFL